ncbi:hypothetical protein GCM10010278_84690 [Streptomyces melanogenes]|nr:hypothetical protein GCM10010278_84690 [Streptomyces melanogenes]
MTLAFMLITVVGGATQAVANSAEREIFFLPSVVVGAKAAAKAAQGAAIAAKGVPIGAKTVAGAKATRMSTNSYVRSSGGYRLSMQEDGNLVMYGPDGQPLYATNTVGRGDHVDMQEDGNFVLYDAGGTPLWHTGTYGNPGAFLVLQDDGNLVIYSADGAPLWSAWNNWH